MNQDINIQHKFEFDRDIYFISDAHIGSRDKEQENIKDRNLNQFFEYLVSLTKPPLLYIVGDLFDFWFEYRYAIPAIYQKILTRLVYCLDHGITIRYVTGNHDFWMRGFFQRYMNIEVYRGIHTFEVNLRRFYVFHGDGIIKEDRGYRILKKFLQNPWLIKMYQMIHPDIGIPIARWASSKSRNHYKKDHEIERIDDQKYIDYAFEEINDCYDYVIMGHTHRPIAAQNEQKIYINLGDWIEHFTFSHFNGKTLKLFCWRGIPTTSSNGESRFLEIAPNKIHQSNKKGMNNIER